MKKPAFPIKDEESTIQGMSLRDWFAGMAMQGIISGCDGEPDEIVVSKWAYMVADAMMNRSHQ